MVTHNFKIGDRRREIAKLLAQSMTETEIALELKVDQSTISRDMKVLKELLRQFRRIKIMLKYIMIIKYALHLFEV